MKRFFGLNLDFLGFSGSFLCAIHCLALPFLLSAGFLGNMSTLHNSIFQWIIIVGLLLVAFLSLYRNFRTGHRKAAPLILGSMGFLGVIIGESMHGTIGHTIAAIGGFTLAIAHYYNWKLMTQHQGYKCTVA